EVIDAGKSDHAPDQIRVPRRGHHRGIRAIVRAVEADAVRIRHSIAYGPLHAGRNVVLHLGAPFAIAGASECRAPARGAARVDLQNSVATRSEQLTFEFVA